MAFPPNLIFFLRPMDASTIYNILSIYESEIDKILAAKQAVVTDHTAKAGILSFKKQYEKQFGEEELEDLKQDLSIFELINPPDNEEQQ